VSSQHHSNKRRREPLTISITTIPFQTTLSYQNKTHNHNKKSFKSYSIPYLTRKPSVHQIQITLRPVTRQQNNSLTLNLIHLDKVASTDNLLQLFLLFIHIFLSTSRSYSTHHILIRHFLLLLLFQGSRTNFLFSGRFLNLLFLLLLLLLWNFNDCFLSNVNGLLLRFFFSLGRIFSSLLRGLNGTPAFRATVPRRVGSL